MKPISLCLIVGNEQDVIERFLESAKPIIGELCMVRAIGSQEADITFDLAQKWAHHNGIEMRFKNYRNAVPFPHVDDFAAARNLSFSLATLPWQMWLDCDDLLTPETCAAIGAMPEAADMVMMGYRKPDGSTCPRERIFRTGKARWKNRIHETCELIASGVVAETEAEIIHSPAKAFRPVNHERNRALLELELRDVDRNLYYLACEQFDNLNLRCIETSKAALALLPPEKIEERYKLMLILSQSETPRQTEWALEAMRLQPHRRDAAALLSQQAIAAGRLSDAISYFRMMDALPEPTPLPWSHAGMWHGWARNYLRVLLLRATGNSAAEDEHDRFMREESYSSGVAEFEERKRA